MSPKLSVVDDFTDLIDGVGENDDISDLFGAPISAESGDVAEEGGESRSPALSIDDAVSELGSRVGDAVDFMISDMFPGWEEAEAFYAGASDIEKEAGRSQVTKTLVRDAVRAAKPNMLRVFVQSDEIVSYEPAEALNYQAAEVAMQQTKFVNQLFWKSGGYSALYNMIHNALLKKAGVLKAYFREDFADEYVNITGVMEEELQQLQQMADVTIVAVDERAPATEVNPAVYDVEVAMRKSEGRIVLSHVPLHEFFVDDNATCPEDATIIGERRNVTVGDAIAMGLEYDGDWEDFDSYDTEDNDTQGESEIRRGYVKEDSDTNHNMDPSNYMFLLTEVYVKFDLDGTGIPQLYCFYLGGTAHEYIQHYRVSENPYAVGQIDMQPDAFFGRSFYDILREDQNTGTSLLRATADNAHMSNNVRLAYHETMVNGKDVASKTVGHPIRFRQAGMIQEVGVSPMIGSMLPLLQYLDMEAQTKVGITNAANGLDPDALQSTDKEAVRNTIQLAQGQIELMCRNLAETGLRFIFDKLLRLSIRHNPRKQMIAMDGNYIPVDQYYFTADMSMKTNVGLGTPDSAMLLSALQQIAAKQEEVLLQYGMENPICTINHLFTTITDMAKLSGITNVGRYFNQVTPEGAQQLDQISAEKAAEAQPEPPSEAIKAAEEIRAQATIEKQKLENMRSKEDNDRDTRVKMIQEMMQDDYNRDKMAQDFALETAKIQGTAVDKAYVQFEQGKARDYQMAQFLEKQAFDREQFWNNLLAQEMQRKQQEQQAMAAQAAQEQAPPPEGGMPPQA